MSHVLASDGTRLYYTVHGHGPHAVLLLHGMGTSDIWRPVLPYLDPEKFTAVLGDFRGHGESAGAPDEITFPRLHDDSLTVLDAAGVNRCVVVGFSGSCKNAAWLAAHAPSRVLGLVLVAPSGFDVVPIPRATMAYFDDFLRTKQTIPPEFEPWFTSRIREEREPVIRSLDGLRPGVLAACAELWLYTPVADVARRITQPVSVVVGRDDAMYHVEFLKVTTLQTLPAATLHVVEAGHFIPAEHPAALAAIIADVCERVTAKVETTT